MYFSYQKRKQSAAVSPWRRCTPKDYYVDEDMLYIPYTGKRHMFSARHVDNERLDIYTKKASLKASASIVSLVSYTGEEELFQCTGTVMEIEHSYSIILTSASLLRSLTVENSVADNVKIIVKLPDGSSIPGQIEAFDFHFNVCAVRIDKILPVASFTHVNDAISIDLNEFYSSQSQLEMSLRPHRSRSFDLIPGVPVIALGRFNEEPYQLMAAPGEFCTDHFDKDNLSYHFDEDNLNCKELFKTTCFITRCGVGGPLINHYAEVIGICFYDESCTPFLPTNVVTLWWEHFKKYRQLRRPYLGIKACNLYTAGIAFLGIIKQKFPGVVKGVYVVEVIQGSSSESVGIRRCDAIVQFGGKRVQSLLELFESIWHKVGESVKLTVVGPERDGFVDVEMVVDEVSSDKLYRWPLLKDIP